MFIPCNIANHRRPMALWFCGTETLKSLTGTFQPPTSRPLPCRHSPFLASIRELQVNTPILSAHDLSSSGGLYSLFTAPRRTLGCAILVTAINDYLGGDIAAHRTAEQFLFPKSLEFKKQYDWAVSLATGINPEWLRNALDHAKPQWDQKRFEEELRARRQAASKCHDITCSSMHSEPLQTHS
jgi:hypothetical protein